MDSSNQTRLFDDHHIYFQQLLRTNSLIDRIADPATAVPFTNLTHYEELLRITPGIIMLINYSQHQYLYHSPNISQLDMDISLMYQYGPLYTLSLFRPEHYQIMRDTIMPELYRLINESIENGRIYDLRVCYSNQMRTSSGEYHWFMHHVSLVAAEDSTPLIGLKYMIDINHFKKDNCIDFVATLKNPDNSETIIAQQAINPVKKQFTTREQQIINLLAIGKTSKQIAHELGISTHTVNNHRKNMMIKANAANNSELISKAFGEFAVHR